MKEKIFKFCESFIAGVYSVKIGKEKYVAFPKVAPIFTVGIPLYGIGEYKDIDLAMYTGAVLVAIGFFGFFYYNIFPSRIPKK
jgi:hypothetical protein